MKILTSLLVVLLLCYVQSQVIGIDFGTQFWKAALISPGKNLVIVENSRSGRKSYNGIAFLDGIRHFEYDAFTKRQKKPKVSYFYLNRLIESLDHDTPLEGYTFKDGTYYFTQGQDTISLEQLVGMILKNVKKYSSGQAGSDIKDAVLTVPAHWGFKAKFALINAAYLADLSVLGIINENSAAAVHFAITRNDTDPINVGFFNMGSNNLQISLVQFFGTYDEVKDKNIESMRVLSHVSIPNFGGLHVDQALAQHVAAQFKTKHGVDVHENLKSWTKLVHKCADLKQTLSANKDANIYIEGLINGIDLNMLVKRQVLEKNEIFGQITKHLQDSIDKADITKSDIHSVEVIGGASRIPMIGKILREFFDPIEVGSHINGDESMAFGAALRAANLSIAFRVKQLHFYDGNPEPVRAVITNIEDGVISENELFDKDSYHGLRKEVTVEKFEQDIKVAVYYGEEVVHEYLLQNVTAWKDKYDRETLNFTEEPKLVLVFAAHSTNFAELKEAYVNITLNTSTTREITQVIVENVTIEEKEEEKQEEQVETEGQEETEQKIQGDENVEQVNEGQEETKKEPKTRERTRNVKKIIDDFKIENKKHFVKSSQEFTKYHRFTKDEAQKLRQVTKRYQKHQNYLKQKSKIRNDFESTLYALKDDFENPGLKTFSTESQIQKLKQSVTEQLQWLDENAWTAEKEEFENHFRTIQKIYYPIVNRSNEYRDRESTYNKTIQVLGLVYQKTAQLNESQPWVQEKAEAHLNKINETVEWIHSSLKKQVDRKLNEDIIFYNHEMIEKAESLRDEYYLIKMIPRPKYTKKAEAPKEQPTDQQLDLDGENQEPDPEANNEDEEQAGQEAEAGSTESPENQKEDL